VCYVEAVPPVMSVSAVAVTGALPQGKAETTRKFGPFSPKVQLTLLNRRILKCRPPASNHASHDRIRLETLAVRV
jgi:hypothetical protein